MGEPTKRSGDSPTKWRAFGIDRAARGAMQSGRRARLAGVAVLFAALALRLFDPAPVAALRLGAFDLFQQISPRTPQGAPVVIVDIDEKSLRALGQWPWPRTRLAELIDRLSAMGPVVIGLDVLFSEPDRLSPDALAETLTTLSPAARAQLREAPSNDAQFGAAIARSRVVLGQSGVRAGGGAGEGPDTSVAILSVDPGADPRDFLIGYPERLRNVPDLERAGVGRGLFTLAPERDGVVRRVPAVAAAGDVIAPSLAIEMLRVATGETTLLVKTGANGVHSVVIGEVAAPTDPQGRIWVHFAPTTQERYVSAVDVLTGAAPVDAIAGKLVLIGTSAIGLLDIRETPIDPALPGVEVHAQLLETLIEGAQLTRYDFALGVELTLAFLIGLGILYAAPGLGAARAALLGVGSVAAIGGLAWLLYSQQRVLFDATFPIWAALAPLIAIAFVNYLQEERERAWIRNAFSRYLAPDVVERLADRPEQLKLGGERRRITVLFADIRGFTALSEKRKDDPEGLTALINRLLTPLSLAIVERGGTIDKYMGDAVMAFWNAPTAVEDHERAAAETALEMQRRIDALNVARKAEAEVRGEEHYPLSVGIGLNTGEALVGNMGSELRFDYSALGDPVNLASRLQGLSDSWGCSVILGEETAKAVGDALAVIELGSARVKGKAEPERVFGVFGDADLAARPSFRALHSSMARLLAAFRSEDWSAAHDALAALEREDSDRLLSDVAARYRDLIAARLR